MIVAPLRLTTVVGARPQFIKAAALSRAIDRVNHQSGAIVVEHRLVHTGQHYDATLSQIFFDELALPAPAAELGVGSGPHGAQTGQMLALLESEFVQDGPDVVLVLGDTNSTLAGALAATKLGLNVAHVEAGLRSGRRDMPEEINRVLTDRVATTLFCPSDSAARNLVAEGIVDGVHVVGDILYDLLAETVARVSRGGLRRAEGRYALATVHRAENTQPDRLAAIFDALGVLSEEGLPVIVPVHPRTRSALEDRRHPPGVTLLDPVGHAELVELATSAQVILTDSGGLQREAYWLGVPCVTLREETEWPETGHDEWNVLAGCDPRKILDAARRRRPDAARREDLGRGRAADAVIAHLLS